MRLDVALPQCPWCKWHNIIFSYPSLTTSVGRPLMCGEVVGGDYVLKESDRQTFSVKNRKNFLEDGCCWNNHSPLSVAGEERERTQRRNVSQSRASFTTRSIVNLSQH